ncbi:MAG: DUF5655 domain-containing protein [Pseudomonadota bacterium]|tara:strand:- start:225 stop:1187 length:963 start_codon:yes stop_codon:yes gene_type:complete
MSDIKLFEVNDGRIRELEPQAPQIEKSLQTLIENNLEPLMGVRFLATEFSTGPVHGGRIDTLGIDEDGTPVIIEYKRTVSENVINQGLFYLDWLMDHKKDFQWLVMDKLGQEVASAVDWSQPRLLCIAADFTRYDSYAVNQINRAIELIRYRRFGSHHLMIELVHTSKLTGKSVPTSTPALVSIKETATSGGERAVNSERYAGQHIANRVKNTSPALRQLWDSVTEFLIALGDDVQMKELKFYVAFKLIKNFVCLEVYPQAATVVAYVKVDPKTVQLEEGFTRDVKQIGHFGTGDLEISMKNVDDFVKAQPLFQRAYDGS